MNWEFPDVQAGFRKVRGTWNQIANVCWITEKTREFQKNIYLCFIDYAKPFDCVDHNKLGEILREMWIPDHITHLLRNLYAGQEATVRILYGKTDWFRTEKGIQQGCLLLPCLFNLYTAHPAKCWTGWITSWNQDHQEKYQQPQTCLWYHSKAESEEEIMSLLMRVKEVSKKASLECNIKKYTHKQKLKAWHFVPSLQGK